MYFKISVRPHQIKVNAGAAVSQFDWVEVGGLKGFAITDSDSNDDVVILVAGLVDEVAIQSFATGGGVTEGALLVWDAALNGGAGAFTDNGATAADHDAIAGYGVSIADGDLDTAASAWLGL